MALRIQKDKNIFFKLTILEYNFYNNSFSFIIPEICDTDIRQSFFSFWLRICNCVIFTILYSVARQHHQMANYLLRSESNKYKLSRFKGGRRSK